MPPMGQALGASAFQSRVGKSMTQLPELWWKPRGTQEDGSALLRKASFLLQNASRD